MSDLASTIRAARLAQGLSQEALARRMDGHRDSISRWELGEKVPRESSIARLERALGLESGSLLALRRTHLVSAREAREHMGRLRRRGWSQCMLAEAAGLSERYVYSIWSGEATRVGAKVADRILGIAISDRVSTPRGRVSSDRANRMIQEMLRAGWTKTWICQQIGRPCATNLELRPTIMRATERRIIELHNRLWRENAVGERPSGNGKGDKVRGVPLRKVCRCLRVPEPKSQRRSEHRRQARGEWVA